MDKISTIFFVIVEISSNKLHNIERDRVILKKRHLIRFKSPSSSLKCCLGTFDPLRAPS